MRSIEDCETRIAELNGEISATERSKGKVGTTGSEMERMQRVKYDHDMADLASLRAIVLECMEDKRLNSHV